MSFVDPRLLSLSSESNNAAPIQMPKRARRRTRPVVIRDHTVLRPLEPRPQRGPHSGTTTGAAGLQDHQTMKKRRKPRAKSIKTARKSAARNAQEARHEPDSDGDLGSVVASDHGVRWKDHLMQWWDNEDLRWSMMPHYVVTLR